MAFPPPQKKTAGPGAPPDPFGPGGGAPPAPPMAPPAGPMGPPGGVRPGQGMDPVMAMLQGLGPEVMGTPPAQPGGAPLGPDGLPFGGSLPEEGFDGGGSDLLAALAGGLGGGGSDPYAVAPGQSDQGFQGAGTGDPNMGLEQLLQLLALGQAGVGGGPQAGGIPSPGAMGPPGGSPFGGY